MSCACVGVGVTVKVVAVVRGWCFCNGVGACVVDAGSGVGGFGGGGGRASSGSAGGGGSGGGGGDGGTPLSVCSLDRLVWCLPRCQDCHLGEDRNRVDLCLVGGMQRQTKGHRHQEPDHLYSPALLP